MPKKTTAENEPEASEPTTAEEELPEPEPRTADPVSNEGGPGAAVRVETFAVGDAWGYRAVAQDGTVVRESGTGFDSEDAALRAARDDASNEGLSLPGSTTYPTRSAWQ